MKANNTITVQVTCINPPAVGENMRFGLQDKSVNLVEGEALEDGSLSFNCKLTVKQTDAGQPNFTGTYTHGTVQERFLYLTLQGLNNGQWQIIKRIKVHLKSITWEQVETALAENKSLRAAVNGQGSASVPLLGDGWMVQ